MCDLTSYILTFSHVALRRACLSNVKVVFWDVLERHNLPVSVSGYKLVTTHVAR